MNKYVFFIARNRNVETRLESILDHVYAFRNSIVFVDFHSMYANVYLFADFDGRCVFILKIRCTIHQ